MCDITKGYCTKKNLFLEQAIKFITVEQISKSMLALHFSIVDINRCMRRTMKYDIIYEKHDFPFCLVLTKSCHMSTKLIEGRNKLYFRKFLSCLRSNLSYHNLSCELIFQFYSCTALIYSFILIFKVKERSPN